MDREEFLERYEVDGDEGVYAEARQLYEQALAGDGGDARVLTEFGYLQDGMSWPPVDPRCRFGRADSLRSDRVIRSLSVMTAVSPADPYRCPAIGRVRSLPCAAGR